MQTIYLKYFKDEESTFIQIVSPANTKSYLVCSNTFPSAANRTVILKTKNNRTVTFGRAEHEFLAYGNQSKVCKMQTLDVVLDYDPAHDCYYFIDEVTDVTVSQ